MHEVVHTQLLYHLYYGHNLCFHIPMQYSHLRGMSTKQHYRSYLSKTEYTIKRYCNCFSNISVLVMLITLYYDLEACGIIIVHLFLLLFCSFKLLLTKVISLCLVTTLKIFTLEKNIIELSSL